MTSPGEHMFMVVGESADFLKLIFWKVKRIIQLLAQEWAFGKLAFPCIR